MTSALLTLFACNQYEMFLIQDDRGAHPNDADLLFVIDNSDSMVEESVALAENFSAFVSQLAAREQGISRVGLPDAVGNYIDYSQDPAAFVDFQLAITTIDARETTGVLRGTTPILHKDDPNLTGSFLRNLMCESTCFADRRVVVSNPDVVCGTPWDGKVSAEFLDCLCGVDAWIGNCGGGTEEGLEAVYSAMCRAVDDPPQECFENTILTPDQRGTNAGLIREKSTLIPVIVTDEGDASHRMQNVEAVPTKYLQLIEAFGVPTAWAVIGPGLDKNLELLCPGLATSWGTLRYEYMAQKTGGVKLDINDPSCNAGDFAAALTQLGNLVSGGIRAYRLPKEPDPRSIVVEIGGETIDLAESVGSDVFGEPLYTDGWSYEAASRTVLLHGDIVPGPDDEIRIYYWPAL